MFLRDPPGDSDVGWSLRIDGLERRKGRNRPRWERIQGLAKTFYQCPSNLQHNPSKNSSLNLLFQVLFTSGIVTLYIAYFQFPFPPVLIQYINLVDSTAGHLGRQGEKKCTIYGKLWLKGPFKSVGKGWIIQ